MFYSIQVYKLLCFLQYYIDYQYINLILTGRLDVFHTALNIILES